MSPILLITRPAEAAERFEAAVRQTATCAYRTVISPLIRIDPVNAVLPEKWGGVAIVTSENGARALERLGVRHTTTVVAVGDRTAEVARSLGYPARSAGGDADDLVHMILSSGELGPFLHLRGEHARGDIAKRLTEAGRTCSEAVTYRQLSAPLSTEARAALMSKGPVILPLFSPRTVSILAEQGPFSAPVIAICMSAAVAERAEHLGPRRLVVAQTPDMSCLAKLTAEALCNAATLEGGDLSH